MLKQVVHKFRKGIKNFMNEKVETYKEILSNSQNRLILGLILLGMGSGLVASAYIHAPQN